MKPSWLLIGLLIFIILYLLSHRPSPSSSPARPVKTRLLQPQFDPETQKLPQVLRRVAKEDRIVIMSIVDQTLARSGSILDLFLKSFRIGQGTKRLLDQLLIFAVDNQAFQYCNSKHHSCFLLSEPGMKSVTWRNEILQNVLQLGYNIVFTNADVMWFRNPIIGTDPLNELAIACDFSSGGSQSMSDKRDGELFYMRSETRPIQFLRFLKMVKFLYPSVHKEPLCQIIQSNNVFKLQIELFDTTRTGDFCQSSWDISKINTMHANCCKDMESKVHDLKLVLDHWEKLNAQSAKNTTSGWSFSSWRASSKCKG